MKKTSINVTGEARELAVFIGNTLRDRGRNSPAYGADVYDRDANHPAGSIIVEGVVDLQQLAGIILDHLSDDVVDATVLDDPTDGIAPAVRTALDALTKAGVHQMERESARYGSPASLEHAACILTEWIDMDERAAEAERERAARDAQHAAERAATLDDAKLFFASATRVSVPWEELGVRKQQYWINVAKAARERYGVTQ